MLFIDLYYDSGVETGGRGWGVLESPPQKKNVSMILVTLILLNNVLECYFGSNYIVIEPIKSVCDFMQ